MAFPFKTGGDFYNCEAQRMRLHNLGANPTETATGLMYFNTGASNLGKHAVVHDGTDFKALAFVDEIATNAEFVELKEKVDLLIGDDVDTDTIIDSWKEVQAFLADIEDTKTLQGMLSSYLPLSGGILRDSWSGGTEIRRVDSNNGNVMLSFSRQDGTIVGGLGFGGINNPIFVTQAGGQNTLLHSGNYSDYALPLSGGTITTNSDGTTLVLYTPNHTWTGICFKPSNSSIGATLVYSAEGFGVSDEGWKHFYPLLHSGNIGDYAIKKNKSIDFQSGLNEAGYGYKAAGWRENGPALMVGANQNYRMVLQSTVIDLGGDRYMPELCFNYSNGGEWIGWKYIAFTDSTVAAAQKLVNSSGASIGNSGSGYTEFGLTSWENYLNGSKVIFRNVSGQTMLINSSGNVTIGEGDLASTIEDCKLYVSGNVYSELLETKLVRYTKYDKSGQQADGYYVGLASQGAEPYQGLLLYTYGETPITLYTSKQQRMTINSSGNVLIGTPNEIKSGAKLQIKGDVYVDGNIIATKEVSAGGAGQEGESGDGGAEVIDKELAKGQSSYTIPNTIGRSAVAVSLYEWNANNGSWDMCLADISVKDATITVTFGSATSVNHKLVAVG